MKTYPLYDVPYLVRDPNEYRMSEKRHQLEVRNQTIVDDYFIARANGLCALDARKQVADKHGISTKRVKNIVIWFFNEALKQKKYVFLQKFSLQKEH